MEITSERLFNNISSGSSTISNFSCKHKLHLFELGLYGFIVAFYTPRYLWVKVLIASVTENNLYYARISCDDEIYKPKLYKGIYETPFKKRYANHRKTFNAEKDKNDTKLTTEYWKLVNKNLVKIVTHIYMKL